MDFLMAMKMPKAIAPMRHRQKTNGSASMEISFPKIPVNPKIKMI